MPRWLLDRETPNPAWADEDGLVALGGRIEPELILRAYRAGVFPWSSRPVPSWWSPDPRAIFELERFRPHRSVGRAVRRGGWRFRINHDFLGVMHACAEPGPGRESTWISGDFITAYGELHRRGFAHSIEVYEEQRLIGGLYGLAIGGLFCGESMFHREADASKAALGFLIERLRAGGFVLLDAQAPTAHLAHMGATSIPREAYLRRLRAALLVCAELEEP